MAWSQAARDAAAEARRRGKTGKRLTYEQFIKGRRPVVVPQGHRVTMRNGKMKVVKIGDGVMSRLIRD